MLKVLKNKWDVISVVLYPLIVAIILIILLQTGALASMLGCGTNVLPHLSDVLRTFKDIQGLGDNIWVTLQSILLGLLLGSLIGYLLAILAALVPVVGKGGITLVTAFNAIPLVALTPIFMKMVKLNDMEIEEMCILAKTIVVALVTMSSMSITAYRGLTETKPFAQDLLASYACNKWTVLWKLRMPNSIPSVFTALKIGIPTAVISAVVAEYFVDSNNGIGKQIKIQIGTLGSYTVGWAYIIVACIMGISLYAILMILQGIILRHRKS